MEVSALPKGEGFNTQEVDISSHEILILLWGDMNEKNLKDAGGFCDTLSYQRFRGGFDIM